MRSRPGRTAYWTFVTVGGAIALLVAIVEFAGCAPARYPMRRCLYDDATLTRFRMGTATMERADGAILFRFDDPTQGDKGTYWFVPVHPGSVVDERGKRLMPCRVGTLVSDPWGGAR